MIVINIKDCEELYDVVRNKLHIPDVLFLTSVGEHVYLYKDMASKDHIRGRWDGQPLLKSVVKKHYPELFL